MALPLWGELEKAQDNDQTIDEAIAAAIAAHEADSEAHLGVGESLQSHKSEDVIDHPAQSIVLDKTPFPIYTMGRNDLSEIGWSPETGSFSANTATLASVQMTSQSTFEGIAGAPWNQQSDYPDADLLVQFQLRLRRDASNTTSLVFGWDGDDGPTGIRMVFEKDGSSWYWRLYDASSVVHQYEISTTADLRKYYTIWYDSVAEEINLFVGTTLVSTYATADWKDWVLPSMFTNITVSTQGFTIWSITDWKAVYSRNVDI